MLSLINLRGYEGDDPLDHLPPVSRYVLAMAVTAVVNTLLVILITRVFRLVQFAGLWVNYVEVASFTILRLLGLAYLGYLALLLLGGLGVSAWPAPVRMLFEMTYVNP